MDKLCINEKKSNGMTIGNKCRFETLNPDDFTIPIDFIKNSCQRSQTFRTDLSWDDHILEAFKKSFSHVSSFKENFPICPTSKHI